MEEFEGDRGEFKSLEGRTGTYSTWPCTCPITSCSLFPNNGLGFSASICDDYCNTNHVLYTFLLPLRLGEHSLTYLFIHCYWLATRVLPSEACCGQHTNGKRPTSFSGGSPYLVRSYKHRPIDFRCPSVSLPPSPPPLSASLGLDRRGHIEYGTLSQFPQQRRQPTDIMCVA